MPHIVNYITIKTKQQHDKVLEKLYREGFHWIDGYANEGWDKLRNRLLFALFNDGKLGYGSIENKDKKMPSITAIRFLSSNRKKSKKHGKQKIITLKVGREIGQLYLEIKIPTQLEDYFKKISNNKSHTSSYWFSEKDTGAKFYELTKKYQELESVQTNSFNDYGSQLVKNGSVNLSPLRTVGASKGVRIFSDKFLDMSNTDFEHYIRETFIATKKLWENCINSFELKAYLTFEID